MKNLKPKTANQRIYLNALENSKITFCIGPAGSGKSYIATRFAANEFIAGNYEKIIITRPQVTAGEEMGFLPGDIEAKLDPYIRVIYDELKVFMSAEQLRKHMEAKTIEICPFAFMRGRTFHRSLIIADEIQNATHDQLKMLLTRFGQHSKMLVNGDITQSDLPKRFQGALFEYATALQDVPEISSVFMTYKDIQREPLVWEILKILEPDSETILETLQELPELVE